MADATVAQATDWQVIQTDAGPVTLAPLEALRSRVSQLNEWAGKSEATSTALHDQASERFAACGAILVPRSGEWVVPPALEADVQRAKELVTRISEDDRQVQELDAHASEGGIFGRIGAWRDGRAAKKDRIADSAGLRSLLIQIAKAVPAATLPEADAEVHAAADLEGQAKSLEVQIRAARNSAALMTQEVTRREGAIRAMGFDALYEAAVLQTRGAQPVQSPLVLKAAETAYLSAPASLARMITKTHYVGSSSGLSFPIGHTGIRYRVGAFKGQPVQQQLLRKLDAGTLVLTNKRVAFIGRTKSTNIPLAKILHVEVYNDGISVFQEGRESPDFYLLTAPKHAVFLLNWLLGNQAKSS